MAAPQPMTPEEKARITVAARKRVQAEATEHQRMLSVALENTIQQERAQCQTEQTEREAKMAKVEEERKQNEEIERKRAEDAAALAQAVKYKPDIADSTEKQSDPTEQSDSTDHTLSAELQETQPLSAVPRRLQSRGAVGRTPTTPVKESVEVDSPGMSTTGLNIALASTSTSDLTSGTLDTPTMVRSLAETKEQLQEVGNRSQTVLAQVAHNLTRPQPYPCR